MKNSKTKKIAVTVAAVIKRGGVRNVTPFFRVSLRDTIREAAAR